MRGRALSLSLGSLGRDGPHVREMETIYDLIETAARIDPHKLALVEGERTMDYGGLLKCARAIAALLLEAGVEPGGAVGVLFPNSIEYVAAFFGVAAAGGVVVPLDPSLGPDEMAYVVADSGVRLIVAAPDCATVLEDALARPCGPPHLVALERAEDAVASVGSGPSVPSRPPRTSDDEALYLYSTGSTGRPKRVARTHANLTTLAENYGGTVGWSAEDGVLFAVPLTHTYALGNMMGAVWCRCALHLLSQFSRRGVLEALAGRRVTVFPSVPYMLELLARSVRSAEPPHSLTMVLSAGEPLHREVYRAFRDAFGVAPRQLYGSTETGVIAVNRAPDVDERWDSVGTPVRGVEVRVVDEAGSPRERGGRGEIVVRSPFMARGYSGAAACESATSFRGGWYWTGDLGRIDGEGYIYIEGRKRSFINVAGYKVDPLEVEEVLERHEAVCEAAVVGARDPRGHEYVKAVVVREDGFEHVGAAELIEYVRDVLAPYKAPRRVEFIPELPRSPTGKKLRESLK